MAEKDIPEVVDEIKLAVTGMGRDAITALLQGQVNLRKILLDELAGHGRDVYGRAVTNEVAQENTQRLSSVDGIITELARREFRVSTLETRSSDSLDFYDVAVWMIKDGLTAALHMGMTMAAQLNNPDLKIVRELTPAEILQAAASTGVIEVWDVKDRYPNAPSGPVVHFPGRGQNMAALKSFVNNICALATSPPQLQAKSNDAEVEASHPAAP